MRRAAALAGTFFHSWATYGLRDTVHQTGQWVRGARTAALAAPGDPAPASTPRPQLGMAITTTWITLADWLHAESVASPTPVATSVAPERVLLVAPPFGKGSGGHWDIMRLIAALQAAGADAELRLYLADGHIDLAEQRNTIRDHFPIAEVVVDIWDRRHVGPQDAVIATGWNTAYAALNCQAGRKLYMVQDFEPWFYSTGTDTVLADRTYDFGFDLITAGNWLPTKLAGRNVGRVATFPLGFDPEVYTDRVAWDERDAVVFYLRPATPRRAWEFGAEALRIFHQEHPQAPIHLVGGRTNLRMPFPATIHDVMTPIELAALYNRCRAGLAISLTNTSLLPVEMLACGMPVVMNDSQSNRLNMAGLPGVSLAELGIQSLARALGEAYETAVDPQAISEAVAGRSWDQAFGSAVEFILGGTTSQP